MGKLKDGLKDLKEEIRETNKAKAAEKSGNGAKTEVK